MIQYHLQAIITWPDAAFKRFWTDLPAMGATLERFSYNRRFGNPMKRLASTITANTPRLAYRIMELHFERRPEVLAYYGEDKRALYLRDTHYNLDALTSALVFEAPELFADYIGDVRDLLTARRIPVTGLPLHIECVGTALRELLDEKQYGYVQPFIEAALRELAG